MNVGKRGINMVFLDELYPDDVTDSVYELNWEGLARQYEGVIFDIDNTLDRKSVV